MAQQPYPSSWYQKPAHYPVSVPAASTPVSESSAGVGNGTLSFTFSGAGEYLSFLTPQPPLPTTPTEDLSSLCVLIQHHSGTTVAMRKTWEPKVLRLNFSTYSTMGFHRVLEKSGMCLIILRRVKTPPQVKCMKRKWESETAVSSWGGGSLCCLVGPVKTVQHSMEWWWATSWRGPLSKRPW